MRPLLGQQISGGPYLDSKSNGQFSLKEELVRVRRVSDMLCTGHAVLRDRYARKALILDVFVLALSTWLVALAFVDPILNRLLTPRFFSTTIWVGVLSVGVFFLSLVQMKTDLKGKAEAHKRTLDLYAEVKREAGYILAAGEFDPVGCRRVLLRYDLASAVGEPLPEVHFLKLKARHRIKVVISKRLDVAPSSSIRLLRLSMWYSDTFKRRK